MTNFEQTLQGKLDSPALLLLQLTRFLCGGAWLIPTASKVHGVEFRELEECWNSALVGAAPSTSSQDRLDSLRATLPVPPGYPAIHQGVP